VENHNGLASIKKPKMCFKKGLQYRWLLITAAQMGSNVFGAEGGKKMKVEE